METIFSLSSLLVMPFWLLMIALPNWRWTQRVMRSLWVVVPAAVLYAVLIVPNAAGALADLANPTLAGIQALLGSAAGATVGWIHFLAFDLFVARWAYLENQDTTHLPWWVMSPTLFLVLMFGPLGLLVYLAARGVRKMGE